MSAAFPRPIQTSTTAPFWEGLKEGKLLAFQCAECKKWYWPYSACREDHNREYLSNMSWKPTSGLGSVFAYNVHLQTFHPAFPAPYIYAVVQLDEGPRLTANIVGVEATPEAIRVGDKVRATFRKIDDDLTVLCFEPLAPRNR
jgi:uncharacterized OB-fold protein